MTKLKNYLPPFLVLSLFRGLTIYFRPFLITHILEPTAILFWAAWRIVSSVNQDIYWMIVIVICFVLMVRLIPLGRSRGSSPAYNYNRYSPNRVEYWRSLMQNAVLGKDEVEYLCDNLKKLLVSINQIDRFDSANLDEPMVLKRSELPIPVRDFLFPTKEKHIMYCGDWRLQLLFFTPKWFRRWAGKYIQPNYNMIEETVRLMEAAMEISNDQ